MKRYLILALVVGFVLLPGFIVLGRSQVSAQTVNDEVTSHPRPKRIAQIKITGEPVIVFDHTTDQQQPLNIPDEQITAWREADGTVNLMIPHYEAYRMRGPDLLHLTIDPNEIYSSTQRGSQITENLYNYHHWLSGPYSLDGRTFYSLAHSEWYACLLNGDCDQTTANGLSATSNSWANTINSFVSADGGASWQLNVVNNNHVVAQTAFYWTGSLALADKIYLQALNHSGMFQPTRVIKEERYYYAVSYYIHRNFSQIDPANGVYQAPIDKTGYALIRTHDITNPNGWQAWIGGGNYQSFPAQNIAVFLPQQNGSNLNAAPPQLVFDTNAQRYILIHTLYGGTNAVYYMTTKSLAIPCWSQSTPILGTAQLITDPGGPVQGFNDANYPSIVDNSSSGFNFEFTGVNPLLFWSTFPAQYGGNNLGRNLYRVQLSVTYDNEEEEQANAHACGGSAILPTVNIDTPSQGSTISGTVTVSGWAIDNSYAVGTAISSVQVKVDGTIVGTATYGISRPDVCAVYPGRPGCPNVGYSFSLNTSSLSSGTHTITVTATDSDGTPDMGSTSVAVTVQATPPTVYIDTPSQGSTVSGTVTISGWAIDNSSAVGTAISSVQVKVDGTIVGTATYGISRPDVCAVYPGRPGCPNVGYSFSLNTSSLSSGTHTITVTATDSDATPDTGSASVSTTK